MSNLDKVIMQINKKYGKTTLMRASEAKGLQYIRIPTGIFNLDLGMGIGTNGLCGIPRGRVILLKGDESTGKTTLCKKHIVEAQKICRHCNTYINAYITSTKLENGNVEITFIDKETGEVIEDKSTLCKCGNPEPMKCVYLDAEGGYDPVWAKTLGVDNNRVYLIQPDYAEQGIDIAEALIRTGEIDVLIIDSIPALVPSVEIEESSADGQVGVHPRLINKLMRLITSGVNSLGLDNPYKPTIIAINQKRMKIGVLFGSPETIPGGKGQNFTASIIIDLKSIGKVDENGDAWTSKKGTEPVGNVIKWYIEKNKTSPPFKRGTFTIFSEDTNIGYLKGEIDNPTQVIRFAEKLGLIKKGGSWFSYKDIKVQGETNFIVELLDNEELYQELKEEVIKIIEKRLATSI